MNYSDFFWKHIDTLSSDTSLAHSFGEKVWNHQQQEIDQLKSKINEVLSFIDSDQLGYDARLGDFYRDIVEILK